MHILKASLRWHFLMSNKLHSYLMQNISAATILPGEFSEDQYASDWLTLPRRRSHPTHVQGIGPAGAAAEAFFFLEQKKLNFGSPGHFSRYPRRGPADLKIQKNPQNRFDAAAPLVNLTTRQTRDSSNQESVLVHLGLQIGLNFVPARKTETRLRRNYGAAGRDFCRTARLSFFIV
jgi:hypothetical protein